MNLTCGIRIFLLLAITLGAMGVISAQTTEQTINVRILPTSTVEEKVANEVKEKELRKAAEEKQAAEEAARIAATSPRDLLAHARILYIRSNTEYFETVQLQNALRKRSEIAGWQIAIVDDWNKRNVADTEIEVDRPLFTFTYTYKITNQKTGVLLATGKVTAWDGDVAAPMLASRIVDEIRKARGESKAKK
jgi:cell division protein FtsL